MADDKSLPTGWGNKSSLPPSWGNKEDIVSDTLAYKVDEVVSEKENINSEVVHSEQKDSIRLNENLNKETVIEDKKDDTEKTVASDINEDMQTEVSVPSISVSADVEETYELPKIELVESVAMNEPNSEIDEEVVESNSKEVKKQKSQNSKSKKVILIVGIIVLIVVFIALICVLFSKKNNNPISESDKQSDTQTVTKESVTELSSEAVLVTESTLEVTSEAVVSSSAIDLSGYVGNWNMKNSFEEELAIRSIKNNTVEFTLWYYRLWSIDNVIAELDDNVASFEWSDDYNTVSGTLTFENDYVIVRILNSDIEYMPVSTKLYDERHELWWMEEGYGEDNPFEAQSESPAIDSSQYEEYEYEEEITTEPSYENFDEEDETEDITPSEESSVPEEENSSIGNVVYDSAVNWSDYIGVWSANKAIHTHGNKTCYDAVLTLESYEESDALHEVGDIYYKLEMCNGNSLYKVSSGSVSSDGDGTYSGTDYSVNIIEMGVYNGGIHFLMTNQYNIWDYGDAYFDLKLE